MQYLGTTTDQRLGAPSGWCIRGLDPLACSASAGEGTVLATVEILFLYQLETWMLTQQTQSAKVEF